MKRLSHNKKSKPKNNILLITIFLLAVFFISFEFLCEQNPGSMQHVEESNNLKSGSEIGFIDIETKSVCTIYELLNNKTLEITSDSNDMSLAIGIIDMSIIYTINKDAPQTVDNTTPGINKIFSINLNKGDVLRLMPINTTETSKITKATYGTNRVIDVNINALQYTKSVMSGVFYALGVIIVALYIIFKKTTIVGPKELFSGLVIIFITLIADMNNRGWQIFMGDTTFLYEMRNIIASVVPFLAFKALSFFKTKHNKVILVLKWISAGNIVFQMLIQIADNTTLSAFIKATGVLVVFAIISAIEILTQNISKNKISKTIINISTYVIGAVLLATTVFTNIFPDIYNESLVMYIVTVCIAIASIKRIIVNIKKMHDRETKHELEITDAITGLWNKKHLDETVLKYKEDNETEIVVIQFDINDLRKRNEQYGHEEGDTVITKVADILKASFDNIGKCFRQGGDEFVVITESKGENYLKAIEDFYNKLSDCNKGMSEELKISVAYGAAVGKGEFISKLTESAYKNMLTSKQQMKTNEFEDDQAYKIVKHAILHESVEPFFQPIRDNKTGKFNKFESLIRIHYNDKIYPPGMFMDYIKHSNQYFTISAQMIKKVFKSFRDIDATVSLNISSQDIANPEISELIKENLRRPHKNKVILELLETEEFNDSEKLIGFLHEVKSLGAMIAIDDFGSGYANLTLISKVKPDFIKIDGEIIKNIEHDTTMVSIVKSVVKIAESINAEVVAEFIENENIQCIIEENDVRFSQGYFYSKPLPIGELQPFLQA